MPINDYPAWICADCGKKHLHRYAAEFAFRYSNRIANGVDDRARADLALQSIAGKRLTYAS